MIKDITQTIRENDKNITNVLSNFSAISDTIAKANISKTLANVNNVLNDIDAVTTKINTGQGSLGLLLNDTKLYTNLEKSSNELNALVKDIKLNPQRYLNFSVFPPSKKQLQYKPVEE